VNVVCPGSKYTLPAFEILMELAGYITMAGWNHFIVPRNSGFHFCGESLSGNGGR
jgi:hypothetical protein